MHKHFPILFPVGLLLEFGFFFQKLFNVHFSTLTRERTDPTDLTQGSDRTMTSVSTGRDNPEGRKLGERGRKKGLEKLKFHGFLVPPESWNVM